MSATFNGSAGRRASANYGRSRAGYQGSTGRSTALPYTLFSGYGLGGFSTNNKVFSAAGQLIPFGPGKTLWFIIQSLGTVASNTETLISCAKVSGGKGFAITRAGTPSGASASYIYLLNGPGSGFAQVFLPDAQGITIACLVWRASDNAVLWASNGSPLASAGVVAGTSTDSTCISNIGSPDAALGGFSTVPLTSARVMAFAVWNSEASSSQAAAGTFTSGNRTQLPASVLSSAVVDFNAARDFNVSGFTTRGSSPLTFSVAGTPSLVKFDEMRYVVDSYYFDGRISSAAVDPNGNAFTAHDSYIRAKMMTDATVVSAEVISPIYSVFSTHAIVGQHVNGVWTSQATLRASTPAIVNLLPGSGTGKTIDMWEGPTTMSGSAGVFPYTRVGTHFQAFRLPVYTNDGATSANSSMLAPAAAPQHRLILVGDSILTAWYQTTPTSGSITALLRGDFPGRVTCRAAGSNSIANIASTAAFVSASAASIASELDGTVSNKVWIQLGTNDYGASPITVANFQSYYGALLDQLHALAPNALIFCQSPIQRISPSSESANGYGSTLGDYRTAISASAAARSSYCTYVNGAGTAIVNNAGMYTDGIHINDSGAVQYKAFIKSTLGY